MQICVSQIDKLLQWDKELRDHVRDYSSRGRAQKNTDCVNFFDLQWLLFFDPEPADSPFSMKGYEVATSNFGKTPWTLLYEYAQGQKLMMHVMRVGDGMEVIAGALELCEHALVYKKSASLASVYWNVALLYASKAEANVYDVGRLFQVKRTMINDEPHIVLQNVLNEFKITRAVLVTNNTEVPLTPQVGSLASGANTFAFVHYGKACSS